MGDYRTSPNLVDDIGALDRRLAATERILHDIRRAQPANMASAIHYTDPWPGSTTTSKSSNTDGTTPAASLIDGMTITADFGARPLIVMWSILASQSGTPLASLTTHVYDNGVATAASARQHTFGGTSYATSYTGVFQLTPGTGTRTVELRAAVGHHSVTTQATVSFAQRQLVILEKRDV